MKLDKFLALTAMLASAQIVNVACTVVDDTDDEPAQDDDADASADEDAGDDEGSEDDEASKDDAGTKADAGDETSADAGAEGDAATEGSSDAGAEGDAAVVGDAATEGSSDAGADAAASEGGSPEGDAAVSDAGGEGDVRFDGGGGDPSGEGVVPECYGGDAADESSVEACFVFDSCYELGAGGVAAGDKCYDLNGRARAGVFEAFWSCYADAGIEDPCAYESDLTALGCSDFAMEGACVDEVAACEGVASNCGELTAEDCNYALAPYNTLYHEAVSYCVTFRASGLDPSYEGCSTDFYNCAADPSLE